MRNQRALNLIIVLSAAGLAASLALGSALGILIVTITVSSGALMLMSVHNKDETNGE